MQVNEGNLLSKLKNNCLQAVLFFPPVVFNTEGEKALITCQGLNNGRHMDRYLTAVLKHQKNEQGESFYSDDENLNENTLKQFMMASMKRLESAVRLSGSFVHERKKPLTRFGRMLFKQENFPTEGTLHGGQQLHRSFR